MTRILLVKLSSLGDVIHNLAVVSDIRYHLPEVQIDWVCETPYAPLLQLHPAIAHALPLSLRGLKKNWAAISAWREFFAQRKNIRQGHYDLIIDTQGLLKSALVTSWNAAPSAGFAALSAREPIAALFYQHKYEVPLLQHAVMRNRQLAAAALGYEIKTDCDYGLQRPDNNPAWLPIQPYVVLLHASSRENKKWPLAHWITLAQRFLALGITPVLPWGNAREHEMSLRIAEALTGAMVPPAMSLIEAAAMLGRAQCVVGVDTGLAHLAVALMRPTLGLYLTTQPQRTGLFGGVRGGMNSSANTINLGGGDKRAPASISVEDVWQAALPWIAA